MGKAFQRLKMENKTVLTLVFLLSSSLYLLSGVYPYVCPSIHVMQTWFYLGLRAKISHQICSILLYFAL